MLGREASFVIPTETWSAAEEGDRPGEAEIGSLLPQLEKGESEGLARIDCHLVAGFFSRCGYGKATGALGPQADAE